jgi:2-aminoadipate transaminase
MVANTEVIKKATILKQASDLHSGNLSQHILYEFLSRYDFDGHISKIKRKYSEQASLMLNTIQQCFPSSVTHTSPAGGMFCWLRLPPQITARELLNRAMKENIIFVPGDSFYAARPDMQTLRLNFSNVDADKMVDALRKLGSMI